MMAAVCQRESAMKKRYVIATKRELKGRVRGALEKAKYVDFDVRAQTNPHRVIIESDLPIESIQKIFGTDYLVEKELVHKSLQ